MKIEQHLYISTGKIDSIASGTRTPPQVSSSVTVGLPAVLSIQAATARPDGIESAEFKRLQRLKKLLGAAAKDFDDPGLEPMAWCRFDMRMNYGTLHADAGGPDEVVAFTGPAPYPIKTGEVDLVLIGSTRHLRDRVGSAGRMGSTSDTLYALARNPDLISLAEPQTDIADPAWPGDLSDAAVELARILDWYRPKWQRARVQGLAQVLHTCPGSYSTRLVVATPLFVQFSGIYDKARTQAFSSITHRWQRRRPQKA